MDNKQFWKIRSQKYNSLQWANNDIYLKRFIDAGEFKRSDKVLDVGTGTGIVAHAVSPLVDQVIGLDRSQDMLEHSNWYGNMYFIRGDIRVPVFNDNVFDKVTCRQVFHHILKKRIDATKECRRILKKGGRLILSEGIPPSLRVKKDYKKIFSLKEKRATFYENDLVGLMKEASFKNINPEKVVLKQMSVKNWISNSGLPVKTQKKIFDLHKYAPDYFKKDYNLTEKKSDCFIDMTMLIITGEK